MSPTLIAGIALIHLALVAYTVGVVAEQRRRRFSGFSLGVLTVGAVADVLATACMAAISTSGILTAHGVLGVAALAVMLAVVILAWRHRSSDPVPGWLHLTTRIFYLFWLVAYFVGAAMAMGRQ